MTSEQKRKFTLIGGFLGAGKTTLTGHYLRWLGNRGLRVAVVANDQGSGLVDTRTFVGSGASVAEVTGGCFCCRLEDLVGILRRLDLEDHPDVIVAEPVGSCTDLAATVLLPLERIYGLPLESSPLSVVLDGRRALAALGGRRQRYDFHKDVVYIYQKQMEEAEWLVVNKTDLLRDEDLAYLRERLRDSFPGKRVFAVSGKNQNGLEDWFQALIGAKSAPGADISVDYERYGRGEAMLGWYNASARVAFSQPACADNWLMETGAAISALLEQSGCQVAHFKAAFEHADGRSRVHQVISGEDVTLAESLAATVDGGRLTLNLRAEGDPAVIDDVVAKVLQSQKDLSFETKDFFRPGQPEPTHRLSRTPNN